MKNVRAFIIAGLIALGVACPAAAQNVTVKVVASCGAESLPTTPGVTPLRVDQTGNLCVNSSAGGGSTVTIQPTSSSSAGITPVVTGAAANNLVLKAGAGNLYSAYATNQTATGGYLMLINATSAPADGAVTPLECVPLPASGNAAISFGSGPPDVFSTGIVAVVSSGANCFTKTTGTITAFIKGNVQ